MVSSSTTMPTPRLSSSAVDRSNTSTSQPRSRRTSAAVSPPSDPPTTATRGQLPARLWPAEDGDTVDAALEQHAPLVEGGVAEAVGRVGADVLGPGLVDGLGRPVPLGGGVLVDLPLGG